MHSSFKCQWKALLWRHYVIKKRNFYQLLLEFLPTLILVFVFKNKFPVPTTSTDITSNSLNLSSKFRFISSGSLNLCVTSSDINNPILSIIKDSLAFSSQKFLVLKVIKNENLLEEALRRGDGSEDSCQVGVVFDSNTTSNGTYIIKIPESKGINDILSHQSGKTCSASQSTSCPALKYYGLLSNLQILIDEAFLQDWTSNTDLKIHNTEMYGYFPNAANFRISFHTLFVLLVILCLAPVSTVLIENILYDKKKKIKESMQLMGMKPLAYWSSWFVIELLPISFNMGVICATLLLKKVFSFVPTVLIFILMFGFGCSIIMLCMVLITVIRKSSVVNTILFGIYATAFLLGYIQNINVVAYFFVRMLSPVTFAHSSLLIFKNEYTLELWISIFQIYAVTLFYAVIGLILDNIFPYDLHFPSFLLKWRRNNEKDKNLSIEETSDCKPPKLEESYDNTEEYLRLQTISKSYGTCCNGSKVLDDITFRIYRGEIVCLLGSNGAGKTTLMKVLSKSISPDDGEISYSPNVNIGICPQENILLEDLSPYEQLSFFGQLKGVPSSELKSMVSKLLSGLDLVHCQSTKTKVLSLGEKRKLCVALAMIGNPEVLLLDEPSSGMSLQSRCQLQNMLNAYSDLGCSVVFTTHYLDEAESIADRIALLNRSKILCCGSSTFLKKNFGAGYKLKIILQEDVSQDTAFKSVTSLAGQLGEIEAETFSQNEILIKLQTSDPIKIAQFLEQLEESSENIGIKSYSIHNSTLEEVFSYADNQLTGKKNDESKNSICPIESTAKEEISPPNKNEKLFFQSFRTLLQYRLILILRNPYSLFPISIPIILLFLCKQLTSDDLGFIEVSPSTYANRNIQIINLTGIPLNSLERSLSKLNLHTTWKDEDETYLEVSTIKAKIYKFENVNDKLEMKCDWHFPLNDALGIPIINNLMSNIMWKNEHSTEERTLELRIQHVKKAEFNSFSLSFRQFILLIEAGFCILFLVYVIGIEIVKEKEGNITSMIYRTNKTCLPYWFSTLVAHYAHCIFSVVVIYVFFKIFTFKCIESSLMISLTSVYIVSLPSCLLFVYTIGRFFKTYRSADLIMPLVIFAAPGVIFALVIIATFRFPAFNTHIASIIICLIYPLYTPYCVALLLSKFLGQEMIVNSSEVEWNVLCCLILPLSIVLYMSALLWLEKGNKNLKRTYSRRTEHLHDESSPDSLVNLDKDSEESQDKQINRWSHIQTLSLKNSVEKNEYKVFIKLEDVRKVYPVKSSCRKRKEKTVLQNLNLNFNKGEVFGLMGSNGAGKSSLIKILAENENITSGNITLWDKERTSISYCPEENVKWSNLTVNEHLRLFASLYGNPYDSLNDTVNRLISDLGMQKYANTKVQHISGGYQRKLNVAISLLGFANMTLLDEPTTGLDAESRCLLWTRLQSEFPRSSKRLLVITSHSSDEVESHCSRIGLLVNGNLRCLGTKEELKSEFGKNFELKIRLKSIENIEDTNDLSALLPQAVKVHKKKNLILYYISKESIQKLSTLFRITEKIKSLPYVEECYLSEVTLNQVILDQIDYVGPTIADQDEFFV